MPAKGQSHSAEARARIAEATRRGQRPWRGGCAIVSAHIRALIQRHEVSPQMEPVMHAAMREAGELVEQLGGADAITAAQRVLLDQWITLRVCAVAGLECALRDPGPAALDRAASFADRATRCLGQLDLVRAKEVDWSQPMDVRFEGEDDAPQHDPGGRG